MEMAIGFVRDSRQSRETVAAAEELLGEAFAAQDESDVVLRRHARHWELSRLALVDRNILRLAVHEMLSGCTPPKVAITEALRLAQEFSTGESARFVNGILDAVYSQIKADTGEDDSAGDDATAGERDDPPVDPPGEPADS